tara:strand:+ start:26 stop:280 length:255 start_codon:yes stop_codon:yes gene_type:complete
MLIWERFDNDDGDETWYTEWHDIDRMALIKKTQTAEHWAVIVGTVKDAEYTTRADTLSDAKAKSIRFMMLIKNATDTEKIKWTI